MNIMQTRFDITQATIKEYLKYSPDTGEFIWIKKANKNTGVNTRAGSLVTRTGYRTITLFGIQLPEHHVAWCYQYGNWSTSQLDHINQDRSDNRIKNLREVTHAENCRNRTRRRNTKVEEAGIWFNKRTNRYVSEITMNGKKVFQKVYKPDAIELAIKERKEKLIELGFSENHGN